MISTLEDIIHKTCNSANNFLSSVQTDIPFSNTDGVAPNLTSSSFKIKY